MDVPEDDLDVDTPRDHDADIVPTNGEASHGDVLRCDDVEQDTRQLEVGQRDFSSEGALCRYAEQGGLTLKGQINLGGQMEVTHHNFQDNRTINKHVHHHQGDLHQHTHKQYLKEADVIHHHGDVHQSHHVYYNENEAGYTQIKAQSELAMHGDQNVFVETWAFRAALQKLSHQGLLVLSGPAGSGKTCLAHALLRHHQQASDLTPLVLHRFEEWRAHAGGDRRQVILLEDVFGKDPSQNTNFVDWVPVFPTIQQLATSDKCVVIITVDDIVLDSIHADHGCYSFLSDALNLAGQDASLSGDEKRRLLERHLKETGKSVSDEVLEEVVQSPHSAVLFPAQCKLFAESPLDDREAMGVFTTGIEETPSPCGTGPKMFVRIPPDVVQKSLMEPAKKVGRWGYAFMNRKDDINVVFYDAEWTSEDIQLMEHCTGPNTNSSGPSEVKKHASLASSKSEEDIAANNQVCDAFSRFQDGCMKGEGDLMLGIIESEFDALFSNENRFSALHVATLSGQTNVVESLLDRQCSVNAADQNAWTPLHVACYSGHTEIAKLLIKYGAKLDMATEHGMSPLHVACRYGHADMVQVLLENDATIEARPTTRCRALPLHVAAFYGHNNVVELLIEFKAQTNATDRGGWLPLHYACQQGHLSVVETLLSAATTHRPADARQSHQLHIRCCNGHVHLVRSLLQCGRSTHDPEGKTAVCRSCYLSHKLPLENLSRHQIYPDKSGHGNVSALYLATQNGHYDVVNALLRAGACTEVRLPQGWTPLLIASFKGHHHIVELLLQYKADVNDSLDNVLWTALHLSAANGRRESVDVLLEHGAIPDIQDTYGYSPLERACLCGHSNAFPSLLPRVKHLYTEKESAGHLLSSASCSDSADVICSLQGWLPEIFQTAQESAALHEACRRGNLEIVNTFLAHDFPFNTSSDSSAYRGERPIHVASVYGHPAVVEALISHGAQVNEKTSGGDTALHLACKEDHIDVVKVLLQKGSADTESRTKRGQTSLHIAANKCFDDIVALLVAYNANVNAQDLIEETPLISGRQHSLVADILLANNADASVRAADGETVLHKVCTYGNEGTLHSLLSHRMNLEIRDRSGQTPLHSACKAKRNRHSMVRLLLQHEANVEAADDQGTTPVQLASHAGDMDLLRELLQHGGRVDSRNKKGETPLHQACMEDHHHVIKVLLQAKAFVDQPDLDGNTPLHKACAHLHTDSVRVLLECGANISIENKDGLSPMNVVQSVRSEAQISKEEKRHRDEKSMGIMIFLMTSNNHFYHKSSPEEVQDSTDERCEKFRQTGTNASDIPLEKGLEESASVIVLGRRAESERGRNGTKEDSKNAEVEKKLVDTFDSGTDVDGVKGKENCTLEGTVSTVGENVERKTGAVFSISTHETDTEKPTTGDLRIDKTVTFETEGVLNIQDPVGPGEHEGSSGKSLASEELATQPRETVKNDEMFASFQNDHAYKEQPVCPEASESPEVDQDQSSLYSYQESQEEPFSSEVAHPLHRACFQGTTSLVRRHLASSSVNAVSDSRRTALHYACAAGQDDIASLLLRCGANPSLTDVSGRTCLHVASFHGRLGTVDLMLTQKLNVNLADKDGRTALHLAASQGHGLVAALLISRGAKVNQVDDQGNSALMLASAGSHQDVGVILINSGADLECRNKQGEAVGDAVKSRNLFMLEASIARHSADRERLPAKERLCRNNWHLSDLSFVAVFVVAFIACAATVFLTWW